MKSRKRKRVLVSFVILLFYLTDPESFSDFLVNTPSQAFSVTGGIAQEGSRVGTQVSEMRDS